MSARGSDAEHTANVFGALSLLVSDRMGDAAGGAAGGPGTTAAALSALLHLLDEPPIDRLGRALGLTSSGTVRLVDRLERAGHVHRRPGRDARSSLVVHALGAPRGPGRSAARMSALDDALGALEPEERRTLGRLAAKMVAAPWTPNRRQGGGSAACATRAPATAPAAAARRTTRRWTHWSDEGSGSREVGLASPTRAVA